MTTPEIIRTSFRGIPCEIIFQDLGTRSETVFWLNPDGLNLPTWPMGHKTLHGVTAAEWQRVKASAQKGLGDE